METCTVARLFPCQQRQARDSGRSLQTHLRQGIHYPGERHGEVQSAPGHSNAAPKFYKYGWFYLFRHGISGTIGKTDEMLLTAASVKTKKAQGAFTDAVNDVVQQHIPRSQWRTSFCPCGCDPLLQLADYCTWAIQRKWERNDARSYDIIKDHITYEYDLWSHGSKHYY